MSDLFGNPKTGFLASRLNERAIKAELRGTLIVIGMSTLIEFDH